MSAKFAALAKRKDEQNALASFAEFFGKKNEVGDEFFDGKKHILLLSKKRGKKGEYLRAKKQTRLIN